MMPGYGVNQVFFNKETNEDCTSRTCTNLTRFSSATSDSISLLSYSQPPLKVDVICESPVMYVMYTYWNFDNSKYL